MYKNHGKHDQQYLIYKFTWFSCNQSCRRCLNHSITNSHSQVQPGGIYHQDWEPSGAPTPVVLNLNDPPMPLGRPPCLIRCRIEALVYLPFWSQGHPPLPPRDSLKTPSRMCMQHWFWGFDKGSWVPVQRICMKSMLLQTINDQCRIWDVWSISLILNSYVENWILSM